MFHVFKEKLLSFRPSVRRSLGFGAANLKTINPDAV